MERWFLYAGMALCLFSLWAIARHDWLRLTRPARRVIGEVVGHRIHRDSDAPSYAAIYRFTAEGAVHEVHDAVHGSRPGPPEGHCRELTYPAGHPELARPPRPLLWGGVYGGLLLMLGLLAAKAAGLLPE